VIGDRSEEADNQAIIIMKLFARGAEARPQFHWIVAVLLLGSFTPARAAEAEARSARELVRQGMEEFRAGKIEESIKSFEGAARVEPDLRPQLWQLGISYYYAGEYAKGRELFEAHQKVNPQDVENAVWHFLCASKLEGVEAARRKFIPITRDSRVPMKKLHRLFAGKGSKEEVLERARRGDGAELKNQMFYAHLYLALYEEALGNAEASLELINKAAGEFGQTHYMGDVARVHEKRRAKNKE
jgi:lipoprotein NlpI